MKRILLAVWLLIASMEQVVAQTLPPYVNDGFLLGWWPFSGNAGDSSGNGNHGTVNGATLTTDRFGAANKAYYFSSANCGPHIRVNMNNVASLHSGLSISMWVMRSGAGCASARLLEFTNDTSANINPTPGLAQWVWNDAGIATFGSWTSMASINANFTQKPNNTWTHLVYTNEGTSAKFYQDGQLIHTMPSTGQLTLGAFAAFGRMNHPSYDAFNGALDDIGVWGRALKECEVHDLYNAPTTPPVVVQYSGGVLTASGGTFMSYQWYLNSVAVPGATSSTCIPTQNGQYTVSVWLNACLYHSLAVSVQNLSAAGASLESGISLHPNPSTDRAVLTRTGRAGQVIRVQVADALGRVVMLDESWRRDSYTLDVSSWSSGVYSVRCVGEDGSMSVMLFSKP